MTQSRESKEYSTTVRLPKFGSLACFMIGIFLLIWKRKGDNNEKNTKCSIGHVVDRRNCQ